MTALTGLFTWIAAGAAVGLVTRPLLPGGPFTGPVSGLSAAVAGGLLGGIVATVLGFGGISALDVRSVVVAALSGLLALLLAEIVSERRRRTPTS